MTETAGQKKIRLANIMKGVAQKWPEKYRLKYDREHNLMLQELALTFHMRFSGEHKIYDTIFSLQEVK